MTPSIRMIVRLNGRVALRLIVLGSIAATLAGCYQTTDVRDNYPVDVRQRHPITLQQGRQTVQVFLGRYRGGLTPRQRADVLAFAQGWRQDATGAIVIDVPTNRATARATTGSLRQIYSIFAASGIPRNSVHMRRYRARSATLASIELNYSKLVANAGPCGLWPKDLGPAAGKGYLKNHPYWNFGCATQHNIAAMVADPADLVQPRSTTPAFEARRSVALDKYINGEDPSSQNRGVEKGKITKVGQ